MKRLSPQAGRVVLQGLVWPALATVAQAACWAILGPNPFVFFFFFPAIIASAVGGGLGAGLVATAASTLAAGGFFAASSGVAPPFESLWILLFAAVGVVVALVGGRLRRSARRVEEVRAEERALVERLTRSEQHLTLAFEAGGMGAWEFDAADGRVRWSPAMEALWGFAPGTFDGRLETALARIHPEDRPRVLAARERALTGDVPYDVEYRIDHPQAGVRWLHSTGRTLAEGTPGRRTRMSGVAVDVTDRRRAMTMLARNEERLQEIFRQVPALVAVFRASDLSYLIVNVRYEQLFRSQGPLLGRRVTTLGAGWAASFVPALREAARTGEPQSLPEETVEVVPGDRRTLDVVLVPLFDGGDRVESVLWFATDVSEAAEARARIEQLVADLRSALKTRDEFISIASHELRTPVTSMALQQELLLRGLERSEGGEVDLERARRLAHASARQLERLTLLIENMLDVSKVVSGRLTLRREKVDIGRLVEAVVRSMRDGGRGSHRITVKAEGRVVAAVDTLRFAQVVGGLLDNALKYGGTAPVEVRVTGEGTRVRVCVQDHGPGIAPEDLGRIFDRFERAVRFENISGFGLGLFLCRAVLEAHGGEVRVESAPGEGATFIVEVPVEAPQDAREGPAPREEADHAAV